MSAYREEKLHHAASFAALFETAIIEETGDGTVRDWNPAAEALFGYAARDAIGTPMSRLVPADREKEHRQVMERVRLGHVVSRIETVRIAKDGTSCDVIGAFSPIRDGSGAVTGAASVWFARSPRAERSEVRTENFAQEQSARESAENANRAKDAFLAVVSHELRSPLNAMMMWVHLMRAAPMSQTEFLRALDTIERNIKTQTKLVEDLLDVSRIVSGKLRLDLRTVDPVAVVEAALEAVRPAAAAKRLTLRSMLDPAGGPVWADQGRLQQIVSNLLSNAVKFTPMGGNITVNLVRDGSSVRITVQDDGVGVTAAFFPFLFDRFRQSDSKPSRSHGGLGLGLAIVKNLVELHGGTVSAESPGQDGGSVFSVRLPINAMRTREFVAEQVGGDGLAAELPSLVGLRILVVDDDADAREALTRFLEARGADVQLVASAAEAIESVRRSRPDILLSDIGLPGVDGYALMEQLRILDRNSGERLPSAAVTAFAGAEDRVRSLAAGFRMHLVKPVDAVELVMVVASLAGRI